MALDPSFRAALVGHSAATRINVALRPLRFEWRHLVAEVAIDWGIVFDLVDVTRRANLAAPLRDTGHLLAMTLRTLHVRKRDIVLLLHTALVALIAGGRWLVMHLVTGRAIQSLGGHAGSAVTERAA